MATPLYRARPGGADILPAHRPAQPITAGIYLSEGLSNSFLITTSAGRIVVNTGMGFEAAVHKANYDAVSPSPTRYIILTQGHVDHVGGVDLFREPGTEIIAQAGNREHQATDARLQAFRGRRSFFAFADAIRRIAAHERGVARAGGDVPAQSHPEPTITVDDTYAFELGGLRVELYATPGGETTDSLVVWLPEAKICFTGNLFSALFGHFPNLVTIRGDRYRDALCFIEGLERVRALAPEVLAVGHHQPVRGAALIQEELLRLRDAVQWVHDETVRGMNEGKSVHELMRMRLPPQLEVGEGYGKVSWSVRAIWEHYAGWFHARSTTELYPVPPWSVFRDLVALAGGADRIAEAARQKVAAGAHVEALHLVEVARAVEPDHPVAIEVALAAHRALLAASTNFWETRWLEKEIGALLQAKGAG